MQKICKTFAMSLCPPLEMKLSQLVGSSSKSDQREAAPAGSEQQQLNNNSSSEPKLEDTVNLITNMLKERRRELDLPNGLEVRMTLVILGLMTLERLCLTHLMSTK